MDILHLQYRAVFLVGWRLNKPSQFWIGDHHIDVLFVLSIVINRKMQSMDRRELERAWRLLKRWVMNSVALASKSQTSVPQLQVGFLVLFENLAYAC